MTVEQHAAQPRKKDTEGAPLNGGQFAGVAKDAPARTELPEDDRRHNAEGTFLFPAPPRNPEQFIDFWATVPISDEALLKFESDYDHRLNMAASGEYKVRVATFIEKRMAEFDAGQSDFKASESYRLKWEGSSERGRQAQLRTEKEARVLAHQDFIAEAKTAVPPPDYTRIDPAKLPYPEIQRSRVRPLARACAMFVYLPKPGVWNEADREAVLEHRIDLGYNNIKTVREIEAEYRLSEVDGFLFND